MLPCRSPQDIPFTRSLMMEWIYVFGSKSSKVVVVGSISCEILLLFLGFCFSSNVTSSAGRGVKGCTVRERMIHVMMSNLIAHIRYSTDQHTRVESWKMEILVLTPSKICPGNWHFHHCCISVTVLLCVCVLKTALKQRCLLYNSITPS